MKKTLFVLAALVIALVGFAGCSNGSSDDNTPTVPREVFATYWGTLTVKGTDYPMCAMLGEKNLAVYSKMKSFSYSQVTYAHKGDGTWLVSAYADGKTPGTDAADVTVTVKTTADPYTADVEIVPMKVTVSCTKGKNYDGSFTKEEDLYGTYWGYLEVSGGKFDMCMEIKKDFAGIHSDQMGFPYYVITFTDNKDGTWLVGCYDKGEDTSQPSKHVRITVDTTKLPFSCKPYVVPMGDFTKFGDCIKGEPYDGRFKY